MATGIIFSAPALVRRSRRVASSGAVGKFCKTQAVSVCGDSVGDVTTVKFPSAILKKGASSAVFPSPPMKRGATPMIFPSRKTIGGAPPIIWGAPHFVGGAPPTVGVAPHFILAASPMKRGAPPMKSDAPHFILAAPPIIFRSPLIIGGAALFAEKPRFSTKLSVSTPFHHENSLLGFQRPGDALGQSESKMGVAKLPPRSGRSRLRGPFSVR